MEASCEGEDRFWEEYGRKKMNKNEIRMRKEYEYVFPVRCTDLAPAVRLIIFTTILLMNKHKFKLCPRTSYLSSITLV